MCHPVRSQTLSINFIGLKVLGRSVLSDSPVRVNDPNRAGFHPALLESSAAVVAESVWPSCQAVPGIDFYIKARGRPSTQTRWFWLPQIKTARSVLRLSAFIYTEHQRLPL